MIERPDTLFPRHWLYYVAVKYLLIVLPMAIAFYVRHQFL
jgi:hypothetical protein